MPTAFVKDPAAVLDYKFNWADWLGATDTITSHTITADAGITVNSSSTTTTAVTVWLSGGTADTDYEVVCRIVTTDGRTDERTMTVRVRER